MTHARAGKPAEPRDLIDVAGLESEYFARVPDADNAAERVAFGTSGHRGSSLRGSFNEAHVIAIVQATCDWRRAQGIDGPLHVGQDTHALSLLAQRTTLEVLAANGVRTLLQRDGGFTPTPVISRAILAWNRGRKTGFADGIVITPSHNPPEDGGIKYNPPHGGPAEGDVTKAIETRANELLAQRCAGAKRTSFEKALRADTTREVDFAEDYATDLDAVIDAAMLAGAKVRLGVDPLGGSSLRLWQVIADKLKLDLDIVNDAVDPRFAFMTLDHDGRIRMDCSSPHAMASLVAMKDRFDLSFANDPDADRHGIVTRGGGLMNPNHYLAVAIRHLLRHRPRWSRDAAVGKTLVSSSLIDRVVAAEGRKLCEVPVGFKWLGPGLFDGRFCFGGEESAGASFLRHDGSAWTTDKDGPLLCLLAAEMLVMTGKDPAQHLEEIQAELGRPLYVRLDTPATREEKARLGRLDPEALSATTLAGDPIVAKLTRAPGNGADLGGLKVVTHRGWFAARPSGTEDICKLYAESFVDEAHLQSIVDEARGMVSAALG